MLQRIIYYFWHILFRVNFLERYILILRFCALIISSRVTSKSISRIIINPPTKDRLYSENVEFTKGKSPWKICALFIKVIFLFKSKTVLNSCMDIIIDGVWPSLYLKLKISLLLYPSFCNLTNIHSATEFFLTLSFQLFLLFPV